MSIKIIINGGEEKSVISLRQHEIKRKKGGLHICSKSTSLSSNVLYFCTRDNTLFLSYDFFSLSSDIERLELNRFAADIYSRLGYVPYHITLLEGVHKVPFGFDVFIDENGEFSIGLSEHILSKLESDITIATILEDIIKENYSNSNEVAVLFSGGLDSTLITLLLKSYTNAKIKLYTASYDQDFLPVDLDNKHSSVLARKLELPIESNSINWNSDFSNLAGEIISYSPNSAHFGGLFKALSQIISYDSHVCSGQNADSITNLGSTTNLRLRNGRIEGLGELFRRLLFNRFPVITSTIYRTFFRMDLTRFTVPLFGYKKILPTGLPNTNHLNNTLRKYIDWDNSKLNPFIYHHLISFMQGSDNHVVCSYFDKDDLNTMTMPFTDYRVIAYYLNRTNNAKQSVIMGKSDLWYLVKDLNENIYKSLWKRESIPNISAEKEFDLGESEYQRMLDFVKSRGCSLSNISHFRLAYLYAVLNKLGS